MNTDMNTDINWYGEISPSECTACGEIHDEGDECPHCGAVEGASVVLSDEDEHALIAQALSATIAASGSL